MNIAMSIALAATLMLLCLSGVQAEIADGQAETDGAGTEDSGPWMNGLMNSAGIGMRDDPDIWTPGNETGE